MEDKDITHQVVMLKEIINKSSDDEYEQDDNCYKCGRPYHYASRCYAKNVNG